LRKGKSGGKQIKLKTKKRKGPCRSWYRSSSNPFEIGDKAEKGTARGKKDDETCMVTKNAGNCSRPKTP